MSHSVLLTQKKYTVTETVKKSTTVYD